MRIRILESQVLGERGFEAFDGGALRVVDDGLPEGNGVVETLEDGVAVAGVTILGLFMSVGRTRAGWFKCRNPG